MLAAADEVKAGRYGAQLYGDEAIAGRSRAAIGPIRAGMSIKAKHGACQFYLFDLKWFYLARVCGWCKKTLAGGLFQPIGAAMPGFPAPVAVSGLRIVSIAADADGFATRAGGAARLRRNSFP